ncbi:MAG: hypothetical protein HYY00_08205 [Chloroflexi bacterium]|nr:hypothetical protein [Chloroflexota bacterium]
MVKLLGIFRRGKEEAQEKEAPARPSCAHPMSHQVTLHEDTANPTKITGLKCTQCGERIR